MDAGVEGAERAHGGFIATRGFDEADALGNVFAATSREIVEPHNLVPLLHEEFGSC